MIVKKEASILASVKAKEQFVHDDIAKLNEKLDIMEAEQIASQDTTKEVENDAMKEQMEDTKQQIHDLEEELLKDV